MTLKLTGQVALRHKMFFKKVGTEWVIADDINTARATHVGVYDEKFYPLLTQACDQYELDKQHSQTQKSDHATDTKQLTITA